MQGRWHGEAVAGVMALVLSALCINIIIIAPNVTGLRAVANVMPR